MTDLVAGRQRRRFSRLDGMDRRGDASAPKCFSNAHHRAARADAGNERIRRPAFAGKLRQQLRPGAFGMARDIVGIGELARQKRAMAAGESGGEIERAEKSALLAADQLQLGAKPGEQTTPLLAHPVRHENRHRMAETSAHRRQRDTGIAAGYFNDRLARPQAAFSPRPQQDRRRHPVFDRAGHVQELGLCINHRPHALDRKVNRDQRGLADHRGKRARRRRRFGRLGCVRHRHRPIEFRDFRPHRSLLGCAETI
jgi:hypothetical protein